MQLIHRDCLEEIRHFYDSPDILVIHGARQVGKTCLMRLIEQELHLKKYDTHFIDLEEMRLLSLLEEGSDSLLSYLIESGILGDQKLHLFIDEIQYLNNPSNFLKLMRDHHSDKVRLIVSGSSSFEIKSKFRESLTGRTINFELLPLSFREFLRFKGSDIRLNAAITSTPIIERLRQMFTEYVLYGGYPRIALETNIRIKESYLSRVINTYIRRDIRDLANVRDIDKFNKLLEVLASQCGQLLNVTELARRTRLTRPTVENYLFILEQTYVIQRLRPFSRNVRSELFKTPKVYFYDTGVVNILSLKGFPRVINGSMFENSIFCEFRKARDVMSFYYWRTQDGKEIAFVIVNADYMLPVEVKLSGTKVRKTAFRYFRDHYHPPKSVCIILAHDEKKDEELELCYPWENIFPETVKYGVGPR